MNLFRKAAFAAASTVLITTAGAMSGIGSTAAQAYELNVSHDVVILDLTPEETQSAAGSNDWADSFCDDQVYPEAVGVSWFTPMNLFNCAPTVRECSAAAPGKPVTVVFYWASIECHI
jgi:hypothetical protein